MLREEHATLITFIWIKRTAFVANSQFTNASILKKGARVDVIYHKPIFGSPFVTRVLLLPNATAKK